jgi:hypothetical protein
VLDGPLSDFPLSVRTIETGGARFAVPEDSIIAVLKLVGDDEVVDDRAALRGMVDRLLMPIFSLGEQLCLPDTEAENQVVVLRIDDDLFGLLVESADAPAHASLETSRDVSPIYGANRMIARMPDGSAVPILDPDSLTLCTLTPPSTALN